ncbi:MAG: choice-of-anchor A family protein [Candidatus Didemnitutus sp.]|nr:choice-of-anchor A family protein [Candidatus Didemnitutus sp.]
MLRSSTSRNTLFAALAALVCGAVVSAQTIAEQSLAGYDELVRSYNVVTFGNLTLNGTHTDGGIAVGGNLTLGSGTVVAMHDTPSTGPDPSLYVQGQITLNGNSQLNRGYVSTPALSNTVQWTYNPANNQYQRELSVGGNALAYNTSDPLAYADPRTVAGPAGWDWSVAQATAISVSLDLASTAATGAIGISGQTLTFTSTADGVVVFTLDASLIVNGIYDINGDGIFDQNNERISNIQVNVGDNQHFVVNVLNSTSDDGSKVLFGGVNNFTAGTNNDQLLWNIIPDSNANTTDLLTLGTDFHGSILAPLVDIQNNNHYLNGQVIAGSLTQTGAEIHYAGGFDGPVIFSPVPEPGTYALIACGLCVVGILARRRLQTHRAARPPADI